MARGVSGSAKVKSKASLGLRLLFVARAHACGVCLYFLIFACHANQYNWFVGSGLQRGNESDTSEFLAVSYFQQDQIHAGPLDEFGTFNTDNFISLGYLKSDISRAGTIEAEVFYQEFSFLAGYADLNIGKEHFVGLGYLVTDSVKLTFSHQQNQQRLNTVTLEHHHQFDSLSYYASVVSLDVDMQNSLLGGRYFNALNSQHFMAIDWEYQQGEQVFNLLASYYFSVAYRLSVASFDGNWYAGSKYFFNQHCALQVGFYNGDESWEMLLVGQF